MKQHLLIFSLLLAFNSCSTMKLKRKTETKDPSVSIDKTSVSNSAAEDFNDFYLRFHADTAFQKSRIRFPIEGSYSDFDTVMTWTRDNWGYLYSTIGQVDTTRYNLAFNKNPDEVFEGVYCKECGFSFEVRFKLINDRWYVTYRQDNNF